MVPVTTKQKDYPIYDMEKNQAMFQSPIRHNCGAFLDPRDSSGSK